MDRNPGTVCPSLCAHRGKVVAARQVVDTRAQSSPEALCLAVITPLPHHLINAARAVHDLLHLHFGLQIIRRWIELAPQTVCRAIQIVHGILKVVFSLASFFLPGFFVRGVRTLAALCCSAALRRSGLIFGVFPAAGEILLEIIHAVFHFADAVAHLSLVKWSCLGKRYCEKADSGKDRCATKYSSYSQAHNFRFLIDCWYVMTMAVGNITKL